MLFPLLKKSIDSKSIYAAVAKDSEMSLDTQDVEDKLYFKDNFGIEFVNATSNQGIQLANWLRHPEVVIEAAELVNKKRQITGVPEFQTEENQNEYLDEIILYAIAITGRNQLKHLKECTLAQVRPAYAQDEEKVFDYAQKIIAAFADVGVSKSKVIIKIPVTYESMHAAKRLTAAGIQCLGTVVHSMEQAIIAAEAGCIYLSPYVDPLLEVIDPSTMQQVPADQKYGVVLTRDIQKYYRAHGIKTKVCAAAFVSANTVLEVSGVDGYTMSPSIINSILHQEAPADFKPAIKKSYTVEEAGEAISYFSNPEGYTEAFLSNTIAVARYTGACKFFTERDEASKPYIVAVLQDAHLL